MKQYKHPDIGREVEVVTATDSTLLKTAKNYIPKTHTYVGVVAPINQKSDDPNSFNMTSGFPNYFKFPMRNIKLKNVISLRYTDEDEELGQVDVNALPEKQTFEFHSERTGEKYIVTQNNGNWSCTCKGYVFRKNCQHINKAKDS